MVESDIEAESAELDSESGEGPAGEGGDPGETAEREPLPMGPGREPAWSQVWQLPVLVLGIGLLAIGVSLSLPNHEGPDFDGALDSTAALLDAGRLEESEAELDKIAAEPEFLAGEKTAERHGRFEQLRSDWLYLTILRRPYVDVESEPVRTALQRVADGYDAAQRLGRFLPARSLRRYAETLALLQQDDRALEIIHQLPEQERAQRASLLRGLIERFADRPSGGSDEALIELLREFESEVAGMTDRNARTAQEVWAASLRAHRLIEAGAGDEAARMLARRIPVLGARLPDPTDERVLAPLYVSLAEAHQQAGRPSDAGVYFRRADALIDPADDLRARVLVGLGHVETLESGLADSGARGRAEGFFNIALRDFPGNDRTIDARLGLADVLAAEPSGQRFAEALARLEEAVRSLADERPTWDPRRVQAIALARRHGERAMEEDRFKDALSLLQVLDPLYAEGPTPPEVLQGLATVHERVAEQSLETADRLDPARLEAGQRPSPEARSMALREAASHFEAAGRRYLEHAERVTFDDARHGDSLWAAARCFDKARAWPEAIRVYGDFVDTRRHDDRRVRALFALGKALLADGQPDSAIERLESLLRDHPSAPVATEAYVPLARAFASVGREAESEQTLLAVVTDHPAITPESPSYREALVDLGRLYHRRGEGDPRAFAQAIERLDEAVRRYGQDDGGARLRFLLADSLRKSVGALDDELSAELPPRRRSELQQLRTERLSEARVLFAQVKTELGRKELARLDPDELVYLRNSHLYEADTLYDMGGVSNLQMAVDLYGRAASRWSSHPASLVAQMQIVNAYCEMGDFTAAQAAHGNALSMLERIPEEAFADPSLPMTRKHWEDWLRWSGELNLLGSQSAITRGDS
ncbi:MAG: tetratricopeptide repeat protein [Planctomycetota bacterium]